MNEHAHRGAFADSFGVHVGAKALARVLCQELQVILQVTYQRFSADQSV
jgi:hypothetical protein